MHTYGVASLTVTALRGIIDKIIDQMMTTDFVRITVKIITDPNLCKKSWSWILIRALENTGSVTLPYTDRDISLTEKSFQLPAHALF